MASVAKSEEGDNSDGDASTTTAATTSSVSSPVTRTANTLEEGSTVVVCTGPTCSQKGSKNSLKILEDLIENGDLKIQVETIKCVSECAECALGPNMEIRAMGDDGPFYPIKNNIRTEDDIRKTILKLE